MKIALRVLAYIVLITGGIVFGHRFIEAYKQRIEVASKRYDHAEAAPPQTDVSTEMQSQTNEPALLEQPGQTNTLSLAVTNALEARSNAPQQVGSAATPPGSSRNGAAVTSLPSLGFNAAITLAAVVGLALLLAQDVSRYLAERVHKSLYDDESSLAGDPEYEHAEQVWANGDYLEAIRLLREFFAKNPRQVHVALRIAEIYEKDLGNNLAAALEYEEILKFKLDPERWGWTAIHLCNLYNRLGQPSKAEALLRRIVSEYGETAAAAKARERLATIDAEVRPEGSLQTESAPPTGLAASESMGPKLPPGFRPKKWRG